LIATAVTVILVGLVYFLLSFKGEHIVKDWSYRLRAMFLDKKGEDLLPFDSSIPPVDGRHSLFGYSYFVLARLLVQRSLVIPDAPNGVSAIVGVGSGGRDSSVCADDPIGEAQGGRR
jgi:hypothetical protein